MGRTVKTIKSSSKKFLKEADVPEYPEDIIQETESFSMQEESDGDDDMPEAVSISTSKAEIITQIKAEREARRLDREIKRQKNVSLQEQNRQARLRKTAEKDEEISEEEEEEEEEEKSILQNVKELSLCPLPENIFEAAILQKQQQNRIRFESENESETEDQTGFNLSEIRETVREHRAKVTKRRLVESLPFAVVEVGSKGKSRISRAELKARRAISLLKLEKAGSQARRIDSVLDRARKTRTAPKVFYRKNSFY